MEVDRCNSEIDENCYPNSEELMKMFEPFYFEIFKYFVMNLYIIDTGFAPSSQTPSFKKITVFRGIYTTNLGS